MKSKWVVRPPAVDEIKFLIMMTRPQYIDQVKEKCLALHYDQKNNFINSRRSFDFLSNQMLWPGHHYPQQEALAAHFRFHKFLCKPVFLCCSLFTPAVSLIKISFFFNGM